MWAACRARRLENFEGNEMSDSELIAAMWALAERPKDDAARDTMRELLALVREHDGAAKDAEIASLRAELDEARRERDALRAVAERRCVFCKENESACAWGHE